MTLSSTWSKVQIPPNLTHTGHLRGQRKLTFDPVVPQTRHMMPAGPKSVNERCVQVRVGRERRSNNHEDRRWKGWKVRLHTQFNHGETEREGVFLPALQTKTVNTGIIICCCNHKKRSACIFDGIESHSIGISKYPAIL